MFICRLDLKIEISNVSKVQLQKKIQFLKRHFTTAAVGGVLMLVRPNSNLNRACSLVTEPYQLLCPYGNLCASM